jgi:hypothetical protein
MLFVIVPDAFAKSVAAKDNTPSSTVVVAGFPCDGTVTNVVTALILTLLLINSFVQANVALIALAFTPDESLVTLIESVNQAAGVTRCKLNDQTVTSLLFSIHIILGEFDIFPVPVVSVGCMHPTTSIVLPAS